ncbi:MAG TPA: PEGA domain-containing protein [Leptospiraceae bacterium]|nr:PEGA domain-containing protein [Leptospiraceae bacterium]HMY30945.1 PEGA domain-containing protein [Leptospiraceae bacterium]HNB97433.1 PEGA domain-containing protein [Leptospiraceae bacterium]HNC55320.1 PEGA domain-containing protein [Leptospiraceae bacterium]HNE09099.1 PEGA domain-containing protein [Leptospiraceae bacterium]
MTSIIQRRSQMSRIRNKLFLNFFPKSILLFFILIPSLFGVDDYFNFLDQSLPEKIEYEKSRKLCVFPFRNKNENEKFQYLSNGIPSVVISNLNGFKFVFDPDVLETVIYHGYGENAKSLPAKESKKTFNRKTISDLNSGQKETLPEKDPRYIKLEVKFIELETPPMLEENLEIGRKNKCFYVLTGEYSTRENDSMSITLEFTNRKNGKVDQIVETVSIRRAYQEMSSMGFKLKKLLFNKEMATILVETGEEVDALVFIDGHYAGKTPLEKTDVASGQHSISINKEGHETLSRVVNLKKDSVSKYSFQLKKIEKKGLISVESEPSGASVYLGMTYLGETPLQNVVVPLGQNRIRIEKEEYVDYFAGVEVDSSKTTTVNAKLKKGKTEDYYKHRLKVFLDYSYFDLSQFSVYSVGLFYASFMYWDYRARVQRDKIRGDPLQGEVAGGLTLFTTYQSFFSGSNSNSITNLLIFYNYQNTIVQSNERAARQFTTYRTASAGGVFAMLALAGLFYYLGVDNDAFEFAFFPPTPVSPSAIQTNTSYDSYVKYNFRF